MENGSTSNTPSKLDEFTEWVENFCDTNHVPSCPYQDEYSEILNMTYSEILGLEADECFAKALMLMNYSTYLEKKMSIADHQLTWCNQAVDFLCSKHWHEYDHLYLPAEIRRQKIVEKSETLQQMQASKLRIDASFSLLKNSYVDLKKRVSLLESLGKKRSFN